MSITSFQTHVITWKHYIVSRLVGPVVIVGIGLGRYKVYAFVREIPARLDDRAKAELKIKGYNDGRHGRVGGGKIEDNAMTIDGGYRILETRSKWNYPAGVKHHLICI
jgi:hypothetical protein